MLIPFVDDDDTDDNTIVDDDNVDGGRKEEDEDDDGEYDGDDCMYMIEHTSPKIETRKHPKVFANRQLPANQKWKS